MNKSCHNWFFTNELANTSNSESYTAIAGKDFYPYTVLTNIMKSLSEDRILNANVHDQFAKISMEWKNTNISADSIIYSVIRRISRESIGTAKLIDTFSFLFHENLNESNYTEKNPLILNFYKAQWIDRASLRVIFRLLKLNFNKNLVINFYFDENILFEDNDKFNYNDIDEAIKQARVSLFKKIRIELNPEICYSDDLNKPNYITNLSSEDHYFDSALALVSQNYEKGLSHLKESKLKNEGYFRILGIIYANMDYIKQAYYAFEKALLVTSDNAEKAHLHYLLGLLSTKRLYNMKAANKHFQDGKKLLTLDNQESRLEFCWLLNGISFMQTIEASWLEEEFKQDKLEQVLKTELKALNIVQNDKGQGPLYLKFNLFSNISFLLEVKGNYKESLLCWSKAFDKYVKTGSQTSEYLYKAYAYRAGMLNWKIGNVSEAVALLNISQSYAEDHRDRLYLERIYYGFGYLHLSQKNYFKASELFMNGLKIAIDLNENTISEYKNALLKTASLSGNYETIKDQLNHFKEIDSNFPTKEECQKFDLKKPKTKLPSYHPSTDLESVPEVDMNAFLINSQSKARVRQLIGKYPQSCDSLLLVCRDFCG